MPAARRWSSSIVDPHFLSRCQRARTRSTNVRLDPVNEAGIERAGDLRRRRGARRISGSSAATSCERAPFGQGPRAARSTTAIARRPGRVRRRARRPALRRARRRRRRRGWRASAPRPRPGARAPPAMRLGRVRDVRSTSAGSVSHSACQPPTARSCSCGIAASIVATRPGACTAAATAARRPPPGCACAASTTSRRGRGAAASATSPTSVCASRAMSRPTLPSVPQAMPSAHATSTSAAAFGVPRQVGHPQVEPRGQRRRHGRARRARGSTACRWRRPTARPARRRAPRASRCRARSRPSSQVAALAPKVVGRGLLQPGAAGNRRGRVAARQIGGAAAAADRARPARRRPRRAAAARAPCRSRPGWWRPSARARRPSASAAATRAVRCRTSGNEQVAGLARRRRRARRGRSSSARAAARIGGTLDAGITPTSASASASATSTSSIACTRRGRGERRVAAGAASWAVGRALDTRRATRRRRRSRARPARRCRNDTRWPRRGTASSVARRSAGTPRRIASRSLSGSPAK